MTLRLPLVLRASLLALALGALAPPAVRAANNPSAQDIASLVQAANQAQVSVYASGLNNPRGLKFGPDGNLYVAEGGVGGQRSTVGRCEQVVAPLGPYTGSRTGGRISRITHDHVRHTVAWDLPSSQTSADTGSLTSGVADIAWLDGRLYAITAGGGCSHGVAGRPNAVVRINSDGSPTLVANLSRYQQMHPVAHPEEDDFEPDGTWYSMIAHDGKLLAVEPNHGEVVAVSASGQVTRLVDVSSTQGHVVPTVIAFGRRSLYIGNLGTFPIVDGSQRIWRLAADGTLSTALKNVTTVLGLAFDRHDNLYILQNTTGAPGPTPGAGSIVMVRPNGDRATIVTGLTLPTGLTVGPDDALYVSNVGLGVPPQGMGQVLRITHPD